MVAVQWAPWVARRGYSSHLNSTQVSSRLHNLGLIQTRLSAPDPPLEEAGGRTDPTPPAEPGAHPHVPRTYPPRGWFHRVRDAGSGSELRAASKTVGVRNKHGHRLVTNDFFFYL